MRVYKAGNDGFTREVNEARARVTEQSNLVVCADGEKATARDSDGLGARLTIVDGHDVAVIKNEFGRHLFAACKRQPRRANLESRVVIGRAYSPSG